MVDVRLHRLVFTEMRIVVQQRVELTWQVLDPLWIFVPQVVDHDRFVTTEAFIKVDARSLGSDFIEELSEDFGVIEIEPAVGVRPRRSWLGAQTTSPNGVGLVRPRVLSQVSEHSLAAGDDSHLLFANKVKR